MKKSYLLFVFFVSIHMLSCQQTFNLKKPDVVKLKKELLDQNYDFNTTMAYFDRNYKADGIKTNILLDPDFNNQECGFTKKYKPGITYIYLNCGEAKPVEEKVIFPKVSVESLKNWIELIYQSSATDIENKWYNPNEYGPVDKEAGCYYTISQQEKTTTVDIWCGS